MPGEDVSYSFYTIFKILTPAIATVFISDMTKKSGCVLESYVKILVRCFVDEMTDGDLGNSSSWRRLSLYNIPVALKSSHSFH
jgi:hypothetical protein